MPETMCRPSKECRARSTCLAYLAVPAEPQWYADFSIEESATGLRCPHRVSIDHYPNVPIRIMSEVDANIRKRSESDDSQ